MKLSLLSKYEFGLIELIAELGKSNSPFILLCVVPIKGFKEVGKSVNKYVLGMLNNCLTVDIALCIKVHSLL